MKTTLYQGHYHTKQDAELSHECRHILRTTVLDLDGFLALDAAGRAARWQSWSLTAKAQAVTLMLIRVNGDWSDDEVAQWIEKYDAKWTPPTPVAAVPDSAVVAALEQLAETHAGFARAARSAGRTDEATYFRRSANSFVRGLQAWKNGTRPISLGKGKWLLPSNRKDGTPHLLRLDGDWTCTCESGSQPHWSSAICIAIELAQEETARDLAALEATPATFGQRLAAARHKHQQLDNALLRTSDDVWYDRVDGYAA